MSFSTESIKFGDQRSALIFSDIAQQAAIHIKTDAKTGRINSDTNKSTQIRKFYDELLLWNERVQGMRNLRDEEYKKQEPFIKMLKAKVAYARGRKHINDNFKAVFDRCIDQINSVETLKDAKLFMEAVLGFCKLEETN